MRPTINLPNALTATRIFLVPLLGRKAFLASRTNAWLSLPMLFFMGTSHGDYIILGK